MLTEYYLEKFRILLNYMCNSFSNVFSSSPIKQLLIKDAVLQVRSVASIPQN